MQVKEKALDVYCGVGTLTLFLARRALEVYGIEANKDEIKTLYFPSMYDIL